MERLFIRFATLTAKVAGKPAGPIKGKRGVRAEDVEAEQPKKAAPSRAKAKA